VSPGKIAKSLPGKIANVSVIADTLPILEGIRGICPLGAGLYRRNASGWQRGIRQMLCLSECSIVSEAQGTCH
jgi:hypothetical protein